MAKFCLTFQQPITIKKSILFIQHSNRRLQRRGEEADKMRGRPLGGDCGLHVEGGVHSGGQINRCAQ